MTVSANSMNNRLHSIWHTGMQQGSETARAAAMSIDLKLLHPLILWYSWQASQQPENALARWQQPTMTIGLGSIARRQLSVQQAACWMMVLLYALPNRHHWIRHHCSTGMSLRHCSLAC